MLRSILCKQLTKFPFYAKILLWALYVLHYTKEVCPMSNNIKTIRRVIALFLLVTMLCIVTVEAEAAVYCTGDGVRVHTEPSGTSPVIGKLYYGDTVSIISEKGGWTKFSYKGSNAYVASSFLSNNKFDEEARFAIIGKSTPLYKKADTKAKKLAQLKACSWVRVITFGSKWSKVSFNLIEGYVKTSTFDFEGVTKPLVLGTASLSYKYNDAGRTKNIERAVKRLNRKVVKNGKTVSLLDVVGKDYVLSTDTGEDDVTYGGGLSQIASTLKRAINDAQHHGCYFKIKKEYHSKWKTPFAKKGEEAMISVKKPKKDFVFKNKSGFDIVIYARYDGETVEIIIARK